MRTKLSRRTILTGMAAGSALAVAPGILAQTRPNVVVVGGGFAGATCARELQRAGIDAILIESSLVYVACPFSNAVIAGWRDLAVQSFSYEAIRAAGVRVIHQNVTAIDVQAKRVSLGDGTTLSYDRLMLSPGVDMRFDALPGYTAEAAEVLPHAWKAGAQTNLLRRQLEAMPDGGTVLMTSPPAPYRCPPGPYERASLIAHYLKTRKPHSKLLLLDAKDAFSKQRLFQAAWAALYPGLLEFVPLSAGGKVTAVNATEKTLTTDFGTHQGDVINVIPPQRAGSIAISAGAADASGWCPIDPVSFESRLLPNVHVIGDAAIAGAMPKSAFAANAQAKVCAAAIVELLAGRQPGVPKLINTCYSLVAPDYGISVAGVYRPANGLLMDIEGAGGTSPLNAPAETRALEARYAEDWFETITQNVFA